MALKSVIFIGINVLFLGYYWLLPILLHRGKAQRGSRPFAGIAHLSLLKDLII
jgi:hypothetical protein